MAIDYPQPLIPDSGFAPVPRRIRATLGGHTILDTTAARYVWEFPPYPQYYVPPEDIDRDVLIDEDHDEKLKRGHARRHGLRVGDIERPGSLRVYSGDADPAVAGYARIDWDAVDEWYEEDERVFVHPRNPYARVDALPATRSVRVEADGVVLAEATAVVMLFETGLPPRCYFSPPDVKFDALEPSETTSACPYKGETSGYWSAVTGGERRDVAWSYNFPTLQVQAIAGRVAFFDERVDTYVDGLLQERPVTSFSG